MNPLNNNFMNRLADIGGNPVMQAPLKAFTAAGGAADGVLKGATRLGGKIGGGLQNVKNRMAQRMPKAAPQQSPMANTQTALQKYGGANINNFANYYKNLGNY